MSFINFSITALCFEGFGTFEVRERAARTGRNPQTGEEIQISDFKPGKELKEAVKEVCTVLQKRL